MEPHRAPPQALFQDSAVCVVRQRTGSPAGDLGGSSQGWLALGGELLPWSYRLCPPAGQLRLPSGRSQRSRKGIRRAQRSLRISLKWARHSSRHKGELAFSSPLGEVQRGEAAGPCSVVQRRENHREGLTSWICETTLSLKFLCGEE